jgi:hypothetical protein
MKTRCIFLGSIVLSFSLCVGLADEVRMNNGDRFVGKVMSLTNDVLTMQSETLGTIHLPRAKVASIDMGTAAASKAPLSAPLTNRPPLIAAGSRTNGATDPSLKDLGANSDLVAMVQKQFLSDAGPEATEKYNELLGGLMSGKMSLNDLSIQAKAAAEQIRSLKKDLGDDAAGGMLDGYLSILEHFLKEVPPQTAAVTNKAVPPPKAKTEAEKEEP